MSCKKRITYMRSVDTDIELDTEMTRSYMKRLFRT